MALQYGPAWSQLVGSFFQNLIRDHQFSLLNIQNESIFAQSFLENHPFLQQEAEPAPEDSEDSDPTIIPDDPTGKAPTSIDQVDTQGATVWCNPNLPDSNCGWSTWGKWLSPEQGFMIYYAISLWQVGATTAIYERTIHNRIWVNGSFNEDVNLLDFTWLVMCLWHLPVYAAIATSGTAILALKDEGKAEAWIDTALLLATNLSMIGVLGVFEGIFALLIWSAEKDNLWDQEDTKSSIIWYSAQTALTAYLQIEVVNKVRQWYFDKEYSREQIEHSACGGQSCDGDNIAKPNTNAEGDNTNDSTEQTSNDNDNNETVETTPTDNNDNGNSQDNDDGWNDNSQPVAPAEEEHSQDWVPTDTDQNPDDGWQLL